MTKNYLPTGKIPAILKDTTKYIPGVCSRTIKNSVHFNPVRKSGVELDPAK